MERNLRKTRVGVVVSDKMDKTIVVAVKDSVQHPLYKKILKRTKKFKVHDENNEAGIGDRVEIMETRKISKDVNWRLVKIIEKAKLRKGLNHREASVLLACEIPEKIQEVYALAEQIKKDFDETLPKCVRMTKESVEALPALHKFCGKAMRLIAPLM